MGDGCADARDHGVIAGQAFAVIVDFRRQRIDCHIAAGGIDDLNRMTPRLALFDEAAGGIIVFAAKNSDAQRPFGGGFADAGGGIDRVIQLWLAKPFGGPHADIVGQRLTAKQHMKRHAAAVGERQLDRPLVPGNRQVGFDHIAQLALAIGGGHIATVLDNGGAGDRKIELTRNGMHEKADLGGVLRPEGFDFGGMERRGAGPCVDLDPQRRQAEFGQADPFFPSEFQCWRLVCCGHARGSLALGGITGLPVSW